MVSKNSLDVRWRDPPDVVHVYWSGGVLSTYRILHLLLVQRRRVRPIFLWTSGEGGGHVGELNALPKLRAALHEELPESARLLLDTRYVMYADRRETRRLQDERRRIQKALRSRHPTSLFYWHLMHTSTFDEYNDEYTHDHEGAAENRFNPASTHETAYRSMPDDGGRSIELVVAEGEGPAELRRSPSMRLLHLVRNTRVGEPVVGYDLHHPRDDTIVATHRFKRNAELARYFGNIRFVFVDRTRVMRQIASHDDNDHGDGNGTGQDTSRENVLRRVLRMCVSCEEGDGDDPPCGKCSRCLANRTL